MTIIGIMMNNLFTVYNEEVSSKTRWLIAIDKSTNNS